jgi:hypothetical protein
MGMLENHQFELERRVILFKPDTTMPDNTLLGYDGDPNAVDEHNSDGEFLLYHSPLGTQYIQFNGVEWRKRALPNVWVELGGGGGTSTLLSIETFTLTSTELAAGKIIVNNTINQNECYSVNLNGSVLFSGFDYTIQNSNEVVFTFSQNQLLTDGDLVQVMYKY